MGDSDDDRHNRTRDKFKRERDDREEREYDRTRREEHDHRRPREYDRRSGRDYERYRERSPYNKRMKREDDPAPGGMPPAFYPPGYPPPYGMPPAPAPWPMQHDMPHQSNHSTDKNSDHDHYMKRFKQFVASLKDEVEEDYAVSEYKRYKVKYKKTSIGKFFKLHQNEEWLRERYHPDYLTQKKKELKQCKIKRLEIYKKISSLGYLDDVGVCQEDQDKLMKALDASVILMEGGSEHDLTILDGRDPNSDKPLVAIPVAKLKKEATPPPPKEDKSDGSDSEGKLDDEGMHKSNPSSPAKETETVKLPQPLHKPQSLFVRSLTPLITRDDLFQVVKAQKLPGFLRLAMDKPIPDRKYYRRAWVTFAHNTDIKEACSILMNSKVEKYDHDLNVVINRELSKRVRFVPSFTRSLYVLQRDVKWLDALVADLDMSAGLWNVAEESTSDNEGEIPDEDAPPKRYKHHNPLLDELQVYAEECLKLPTLTELDQGETDEDEIHLVGNDKKLRVLDKVILYLRIVHMVDYYNGTEFPNEDEMPNKIGVFHIRGPVEVASSINSIQDVSDWKKQLGKKLQNVLDDLRGVTISDQEADEIGMKKESEAVEEFVKLNTEEQGPGKFHCPLSGKKFKGPEFVRKHIFNKHAEKVESVKKDVVYWNNYVLDPKRQMNPLFPPLIGAHNGGSGYGNYSSSTPNTSYTSSSRSNFPGYPYPYPTPFPAAPAPKGRKVISYNDLDAPDDYDVLGI